MVLFADRYRLRALERVLDFFFPLAFRFVDALAVAFFFRDAGPAELFFVAFAARRLPEKILSQESAYFSLLPVFRTVTLLAPCSYKSNETMAHL